MRKPHIDSICTKCGATFGDHSVFRNSCPSATELGEIMPGHFSNVRFSNSGHIRGDALDAIRKALTDCHDQLRNRSTKHPMIVFMEAVESILNQPYRP